jgi:phytoene dehydrogenase-like protein
VAMISVRKEIRLAMPNEQRSGLPQIVVVGGGFGGLHAARDLARAPVEVTLRLEGPQPMPGVARSSGFIAWLLWAGVHIYFLIGYLNRVFVALGWAMAFLTNSRTARSFPSEQTALEAATVDLFKPVSRAPAGARITAAGKGPL